MQKVVECVPNFSDGRRPEVYNAIAEAIKSAPGTHILDISADADHNRSVITFVGSPEAVEEGAFRGIAEAAKRIDLDNHKGEHPRIGATDVCPIIPIKNVSVDECITLANRLGQRVGSELGIAVYLYGAAATRPDRVKLSTIRRGQYELWRDEVADNPNRTPDFGPAEAKSWGATVIGVRPFLIAYNIYLNSDDVDLANKIAKSVRFSSGGLRYVQALGFLVDGQAQVSMNLTDFNKTPIHTLQEMVRTEAARYGLSVVKSELIGLAPQKAFLDSAQWYLQLNEFDEDQVLENRMAEEMEKDFTPLAILEKTAAGTPTPGGGSAAAVAGALGAALVQMVSELTVGRKKYLEFEEEAQAILQEAETIRTKLASAITEDANAFDQLMAIWRDKELTGSERDERIEQATIYAGEVPLGVARLSLIVAKLASRIVASGNVNAITDGAAAGILARSAIEIAALNIRINSKDLKNQEIAENWLAEIQVLEAEVKATAQLISENAADRGNF
jgi:glutamate formiminotransferase/formiminotetrahydrofolate cyclodeaminase